MYTLCVVCVSCHSIVCIEVKNNCVSNLTFEAPTMSFRSLRVVLCAKCSSLSQPPSTFANSHICRMMNVFHDLPTAKQIDLLSDWLSYSDVANLDSATCCSAYRSELLRILSSHECRFSEFQIFDDLCMVNWFIGRKLRLKTVKMTLLFLSNITARKALLETIGSCVKHLDLDCDSQFDIHLLLDEIFFDVGRTCSALRSLYVQDADLDGTFSLLIHNNPHLRELKLEYCDKIPHSALNACCLSPNLRWLQLFLCTFNNCDEPFLGSGNSPCTLLRIENDILLDALTDNLCKRFTQSD